MKVISIAIAVFSTFIVTFSAQAGELRFLTERPKSGDEIQARYIADKTLQNAANLKLIAYAFADDKSQPTAYQFDLTKKTNNEYSTSFSAPANTVFLLYKVGNGRQFDNNGDKFWEQMIYGANGKPLKYAYLRAGVSLFGNLMENCRRTADINRALDYLEQEITLYPDNTHAQIGVLQAKFETKKITKEEFDSQLKTIVSSQFDVGRENLVRSYTRAMKVVGMTERADELQSKFIELHPKSELAEETAIARLSATQTKEDFLPLAKKFIETFPSSPYNARISDAILSNFMQENNARGAAEFFAPPFKIPAIVAAKIAGYYAEKDSAENAKQWIARALAAANDAEQNARPKFYADCEWNVERQNELATITGTRAFIEKTSRNYNEALNLYRQAISLSGSDAPDDFYAQIVDILVLSGRNAEALDSAASYIALAVQSPEITENFKTAYIAVHNSMLGFDSTLSSLKLKSAEIRQARIAAAKLNIPVMNGVLSTLDGKTIKVADLKGKVVILDFWATWCGPCRASFPAMQKLYDKYRDNPNIAFAVVNVWERATDRKKQASEFLAKNSYTFPIYFDLKDEIVQSLGVTGIPAKFYLDKNGIARFREIGFDGEDKFLEAATDKISVLLRDN